MDRNYFLSYSHKIILLLLLVAVGKLNVKLISVTDGKDVLLYCEDIHTQRCITDVSVHHGVDGSVLHKSADHNSVNSLCSGSQHHLSLSNHLFTEILLIKNIKTITNHNDLIFLHLFGRRNIFFNFKEWGNFHINSVRLIDGFKFIIKIPDKLIHTINH
ncbi:hypothetical protein [Chryseobacterium gleum]|uniref:hypothetical protein n=1 Tax=Chryseobacterium gleum TaxID=250 RepID=UPI00241F43E0|nr:hypothetical protein [Chryseobacterium gleum]